MTNIPVSFKFEGKQYAGHLLAVSGSGNNHFHLMVDRYYCGQLFFSESQGWQMDGPFKDYVEFFGDVVVAWCQ